MTTWSKGVALLAASLVLGAGPAAQYQPTPLGAARMPEPTPVAPSQALSQTPSLIPGPITPLDAPPGPPATLSLPSNHTGAFQSVDWPSEQNFYAHVGALMLKRQDIGSFAIGTYGSGVLDTGAAPLAGAPTVVNFQDQVPHGGWGVTSTLGYLFDDSAIELSGFWTESSRRTEQAAAQGQINMPFFNAPLGFEGDNGMWLQADRLQTKIYSRLWSLGVDYRYANIAVTELELLMGIRYYDQTDGLRVFTDDDGLTNVDLAGNADPTRMATYRVLARNRFIAPELGFEYHHGVLKWLSVGINAKGAWGGNFAQVNYSLRRGDGLLGLDATKSDLVFSHAYSMNMFFELHVLERLKVRTGYNLMWLCQWATAPANFTYDLSAPTTTPDFNHDGSIFYHGPQIEVQFLF